MCQKVGPVAESVQEAATSYKGLTAHLQQTVRSFTFATSSLQAKIQVVVGESTDTQKVIASQLEDQGLAFRHLAANVEGFHEDLRQGGQTSQLARDILGVSKQPVMEPEARTRYDWLSGDVGRCGKRGFRRGIGSRWPVCSHAEDLNCI